jgi:hypothetical protein
MRILITIFVFLFLATIINGQVTYSGPDSGSISSGVTVNTNNFSEMPVKFQQRFKLFVNQPVEDLIDPSNLVAPTGIEGSNVIIDPMYKGTRTSAEEIIIFQNFDGLDDPGNYIPPDPYIAAGPDHLIQIDNSRFRISDKAGNTTKTIDADEWFASTLTDASAFDPKVIYDHYDQRWVMVWLDADFSSSNGYFLLSVSDDADPQGVWFNWALPSSTNGNTPAGNVGDYQGVGFDSSSIIITSRQFGPETKDYDKIRIIDKSEIYIDSNPGAVNWRDIWNISYPGTAILPDGIRPARMQQPSNEFYLTVTLSSSSSIGLYKLFKSLNTRRGRWLKNKK